MLKIVSSTVFNVGADAIVNTVNCEGFMGAGLAQEFKFRFPEMYKNYKNDVSLGKVRIGELISYKENNQVIINFPTKIRFIMPSEIEWIIEGLHFFKNHYKDYNINSVAFPKLGSGKGKLNFNVVEKIMIDYLKDLDIDVFICLDQLNEAEGLEKEMIIYLNCNHDEIFSKLNLTTIQRRNLEEKIPYNRIRHVSCIPKIGSRTYEKLFVYLSRNSKNSNHQISLFESE